MKTLIGACIALLLALASAMWLLKGAWGREAELGAQLTAVSGQIDRLEQRFGKLDRVLVDLNGKTSRNAQQLKTTLERIDRVKKTSTDTPQQMACLSVPVPAELDRILLDSNSARPDVPGAGGAAAANR